MLANFIKDENLREEVKAFLVSYLHKEALRKVFEKENVVGMAEAKEVLEKAFDELANLAEPRPKINNINEAR